MRTAVYNGFLSGFLGVIALVSGSVSGAALPAKKKADIPSAEAQQEFREQMSRDFIVRSLGTLVVSNRRGTTQVKGWALNRVRVVAQMRVSAAHAEEAKKKFKSMDIKFDESNGRIEVRARYGAGQDIDQRLREWSDAHASMDLEILAPAQMALELWSLRHSVKLSHWRGSVQLRAEGGDLEIQDVRAREMRVNCPACRIEISECKGELRVTGGQPDVSLREVRSGSVYVETSNGDIDVDQVTGSQVYVTDAGSISGRRLEGRVEFRTRTGAVELLQSSGFASGRSVSGRIRVEMNRWRALDKAFFDSDSGDIELLLPRDFSSEVELSSQGGGARVEFPFRMQPPPRNLYGPFPGEPVQGSRHWLGTIGSGTGTLDVRTKRGTILLRPSG